MLPCMCTVVAGLKEIKWVGVDWINSACTRNILHVSRKRKKHNYN